MALDFWMQIKDRETGTITEMFTQLSLTPRELGIIHKMQEAFFEGLDLDFVSGIE